MSYYEDNVTEELTCLQQTLGDNFTSELQSSQFAAVNVILQSATQLLLLPFTLVLNLLVIIVVAKTKQLQTPPFYVALQVVCSNIMMSFLSTSSAVFSAIGGGWILGSVLCIFIAVAFAVLSWVRFLLLLMLATDCALCTFVPIRYPRKQKTLLLLMSILTWALLAIISILPLPGLMDCYGYHSSRLSCFFTDLCHSHCKIFIVRNILIVIPSCVFPIVLYGCI